MKTALWMVDGVTQVVLSPETEWERTALRQIQSGKLTVLSGSFFECRGGYWRGTATTQGIYDREPTREDTILRIDRHEDAQEVA
jgi:hypothetical protein